MTGGVVSKARYHFTQMTFFKQTDGRFRLRQHLRLITFGALGSSQEGDRYTVEAMSNSSLQAGENIEIGFTGTARDDNIAINNARTELYGLDEILMDASENIGFRGATQTQENEPRSIIKRLIRSLLKMLQLFRLQNRNQI